MISTIVHNSAYVKITQYNAKRLTQHRYQAARLRPHLRSNCIRSSPSTDDPPARIGLQPGRAKPLRRRPALVSFRSDRTQKQCGSPGVRGGRALVARLLTDRAGSEDHPASGARPGHASDRVRRGAMRADSGTPWQLRESEGSDACRPTTGRLRPAVRITQRVERGQGTPATRAAAERCGQCQR